MPQMSVALRPKIDSGDIVCETLELQLLADDLGCCHYYGCIRAPQWALDRIFVAGVQGMNELIATLGSKPEAPETAFTLAPYSLTAHTQAPLEAGMAAVRYLSAIAHGIQLQLDARGTIQTIFLHGAGKDDFSQYGGALGHGLTFASSRAEVEAVLGAPDRGASPGRTLLGAHGGWLRYDHPTHSVHFSFDAAGGLALVTILTAEARPK
ncbi:hypothetical protein ASE35_14080 [Lysobacter sp. Root916]|nr:hypothetical protein ASE35_14080 [Lysobacter sp. Root916]